MEVNCDFWFFYSAEQECGAARYNMKQEQKMWFELARATTVAWEKKTYLPQA